MTGRLGSQEPHNYENYADMCCQLNFGVACGRTPSAGTLTWDLTWD